LIVSAGCYDDGTKVEYDHDAFRRKVSHTNWINDFVTISKKADAEWDAIMPQVEAAFNIKALLCQI
jgi:phage baseplate assembly protein gpV